MISLYSSKGKTLKRSIEVLTLLVSVLPEVGNLSLVKQVHCLSIQNGLCDDILRMNLLDVCAKCSDLEASAQLSIEVPYRKCITWCALMLGGSVKMDTLKRRLICFIKC